MDKQYTEYLDKLENSFIRFFTKEKYIEEIAVDITSKVDPTVDFIGSKISPLKHYVVEGNIGVPGRFLIQNCIKLTSLQQLKTGEFKMFGGYYKGMGVLAVPDLKRITNDLFEFLTSPDYLGISVNDLCIRICSEDFDLMDAVSDVDFRIKREVDTVSKKHYRHVYGMEEYGITGRDYNIGLRRKGTDVFINCGTFVVMENNEGPIAVDMGLGNLTFSMCHFGNLTSASSSRMADIYCIHSNEDNKMVDTLMIIAALFKENVTQNPSRHFKKKFRQYLNVMCYWNQIINLSPERIVDIIVEYLKLEYHEDYSKNRLDWENTIGNAICRYGDR